MRVGLGIDAGRERLAQFFSHGLVDLARVATGTRGHFRSQQGRNQTVLVSGPDRTVAAQERGAGAFFTAKTQRALEQPLSEVFEADRHFVQATAQALGHPIDHAAADHGLADRCIGTPLGTVLKQVIDGHGEVAVGRHQST